MEENATTPQPTVMSTGIRYGLIASLVSIAYMLVLIALGSSPFEQDWKGWIGIVITAAMIVLAHKYYKDNSDGFMSYGQGLGISMVLVMVSIIVGGLFTFIYITFVDPSIFEAIWTRTAEQMEEQGQSDEAIETAVGWGRKLFWVFYIVGGAFWGLILGLIVSIFTQKKNPEPAF
jgi:hypothetical protein